MSERSNTNVRTAPIVSRTKMKHNVTQILFIYVATRGLVVQFPATRQCFIHLREDHTRWTHVAIVVRILNALDRLTISVWLLHQKQTGSCELITSSRFTNMASAITQRSSSVQTISDSTLSTLMPEQAENGRIC